MRTQARSVAKLTDASTPSRAFSRLSRRAAQLPHDMPRTVSHTSCLPSASVWAKLLTTTSVPVSLLPGDGRPGPSRYTTTCSSRAIVAESAWWAADEGSLHDIPTVAPKPPDHHGNRGSCVRVLLALSGSAGASSPGRVPIRRRPRGLALELLTVRDAFLPDPASSSVAAIYLTVKNSGSQADSLIGVGARRPTAPC